MWLHSRATPKDRVVDHQENAGADHSDENAVQIQARDACHPAIGPNTIQAMNDISIPLF
jgi:hypothetical protein